MVGDGVFETCAVRRGEAFALSRHLRRLRRSADILGLTCPDESVLRGAVAETLRVAGPLPLGRLRITLTGGAGPLGSERGPAGPGLVVAVAPGTPWPERIAVVSVPWTRNERSAVAGAKTTSYAENVVALARARSQGAHEALLGNTRGELCEGTGSNVVLVLDGRLVTPPLSSGCLAGITRELLLEWAADDGFPISEETVPAEALSRAEDVLLTSSTRDVQHVSTVDGRQLPVTEPGRRAAELFALRSAGDLDP
ncbi:MAG: 4-amino-4-deoxychorismate lyase [Actinomycetales bacterium]|nr:4-amino-4-deoxychorismate lyase [Actinomycetales bacterium]